MLGEFLEPPDLVVTKMSQEGPCRVWREDFRKVSERFCQRSMSKEQLTQKWSESNCLMKTKSAMGLRWSGGNVISAQCSECQSGEF